MEPYTGLTVSYIRSGSGNNFYRIWFPDLGEDSLGDDADYSRSEFTLVRTYLLWLVFHVNALFLILIQIQVCFTAIVPTFTFLDILQLSLR